MQHNAAFHQGLHCLLRLKQPSGTENSPRDTLKYTMGSPIPIVSIYMGNSIRIQRDNKVKVKYNTHSVIMIFVDYLGFLPDSLFGQV